MINDLATYKEYFRLMAEESAAHKLLKSFYYGDSLRINAGARDNTVYPCLWVETPEINFIDTYALYRGSINIVSPAMPDDFDAQDAAVSEAYEIVRDIISKLKKDSKRIVNETVFNLQTTGITIFPIVGINFDNQWGARLEFSIEAALDLCFIDDNWN